MQTFSEFARLGLMGLACVCLGCGSDGSKEPCDVLADCYCSTSDSVLMPTEIRTLMCSTFRAGEGCSGLTPEQCDEDCRLAYRLSVAEEICAPGGDSVDGPVVTDDTSATDALELVQAQAAAWSSGAFPVRLDCANIRSDGACRGWDIVMAAADKDTHLHLWIVTGLALWSREPMATTASEPLAAGWLDSVAVAAAAFALQPAQVDIVSSSLGGGADPVWVFGFAHMEGNDRVTDTLVVIDALTGEVRP